MYKYLFIAALAALIMIPFGTVDNASAAMKNLKNCEASSKDNPCKISLRLHSETKNTYGLVPEESGKRDNVGSQTTKQDSQSASQTDNEPQLSGDCPSM